MSKKGKIIPLIIQLVFIVALIVGFIVIQKIMVSPIETFVFARDIMPNTIIQEADISVISIPRDALDKNIIKTKEDVIGKATIGHVYEGQQVITKQLQSSDKISVLSDLELSNYRKITLPLDSSMAVGGNVTMGDKVDLQFTGQVKSNGTQSTTYTKTFMQDVLVYNVIDDSGKRFLDQTESQGVPVDANGEPIESGSLKLVTLVVTTKQADEITARLESGKIRLVGRFEDSVNSNSDGFTIGDKSTDYIDVLPKALEK